jgi:hypothetical protein
MGRERRKYFARQINSNCVSAISALVLSNSGTRNQGSRVAAREDDQGKHLRIE